MQSKDTLSQITPSLENKEVMIPLTQSLYVAAKAKDVKTVMVELGTGFYAPKTIPAAKEFLQRKVDLVGKNSESLLNVVIATRKNVEAIVMTMQMKMDMIKAGREQQRAQTQM